MGWYITPIFGLLCQLLPLPRLASLASLSRRISSGSSGPSGRLSRKKKLSRNFHPRTVVNSTV